MDRLDAYNVLESTYWYLRRQHPQNYAALRLIIDAQRRILDLSITSIPRKWEDYYRSLKNA